MSDRLPAPRGVNPRITRMWGELIARMLAHTEERLWERMKEQIAAEQGVAEYDVFKAAQLAKLRSQVEAELGRSAEQVLRKAEEMLDKAREAGQGMAETDLRALGLDYAVSRTTFHALGQVSADTLAALTGIFPVALREFTDVYQRIAAAPVSSVILGTQTRIEATQEMLTHAARHGLTGFIDRGGRRWRMDSYAEMATRTGTMHAMNGAYLHGLHEAGHNLVQIPDHSYECDLCRPWEGKILTLANTAAPVVVEHLINDGEYITIKPAGTVAEASAAGLWHPNCTHRAVAYLPGATPARRTVDDKETYEASQVQRGIERKIREAKRERAAAFTEDAKKQANAKVAKWQKAMRDHLDKHPKLNRKRYREIDVMNVKTPHGGRPPGAFFHI